MKPLSKRVAEQLADVQKRMDALLDSVATEERSSLTEAETAQFEELRQERDGLSKQLADLEAEEVRKGEISEVTKRYAPARVTSEPTTYRKGDAQSPSYFRDLTAVGLNRPDSRSALDRLERSSREVEIEARALTTTDGAGGDFVPPLWMVDDFVELARAGRVTADRCRVASLPTGTDSINLPKIATGTAVAEQATQNTNVQETDATTGTSTGAVATIAGRQILPVQLIEQSPVNMDEVILADLAADYAVKLDAFVLSSNAAGKRGLLNVTGINAVTYTDASPTVGELYAKIADGIQQIHTQRFLPPEAIVMHPRRWAWFLSALDTAGRPIVVPAANGPFNGVGVQGEVASQGFVGTLQGLPVFVDPNVPINLGAGTNEDRVILARFSDVWLYEGSQRAEAFRETKAEQLSVLLRFYNYAALVSDRYPKAISVVSGTGLVTPTF